jgi:hypothetical protein
MLGRPVNERIRHYVRRSNVNKKRGKTFYGLRNCGNENKEESVICEFCGDLKFNEIGALGDNQDPEDLFLNMKVSQNREFILEF